MKEYLPCLNWIKNYNKSNFSGDLSAGLTVGVMLIPQGMAYAMLAGMPAIYGLYASTIPLLVYALLGTSRQLAVGPVAMVSLLISSSVVHLAEVNSTEFISLAILLALMVGLIQTIMGAFRLGFVVNFLSHPVIAGFTSAAAIIIGFSQLKYLLGIDIPRGKVHEIIETVFLKYDEINIPTIILGSIAIILLLFIKRMNKRIPGPLIAVGLGIGAVYLLDLKQSGLEIVGDIPGGLPSPSIPNWNMNSVKLLLPTALAISFISFIESFAVAKAIQKKHKYYEIDNNQELLALGLSNVFGSFFQAFPVTGGFSRSAVNDQAGARTGLASIISASLIVLTLLFLTSYFYNLPKAILSAIIMVAVFGLIDIKEAKHLWKTDRRDFVLFIITAACTLILGIEEGIIFGVLLSLTVVIYQASYPHIAVLGRIREANIFRNSKRNEDAELIKDTLIFRFDARLYFANCNYFKEFVINELENSSSIKNVVMDASSINGIDSSASHVLKDLIIDLRSQNIEFYLTNVKGPIRDILGQNGIMTLIDKNHIFNTLNEAVDLIEAKQKNK